MEQKTSLGRPIRFGTFEVDPRAGELRKQGVKVKLQEQPLQVLAMLLEYPREVITREELKQRLWPADTFVDFENGLNKAINKLREALGDSAENARFVETLPRHGYRFIAPVETVVPGIGGRTPSVTAAPSSTTVAGPPVLMEPRAAVSSPGLPEMERERTQRTGVRSLLAAVGVGAGILLALLFGLNVAGLQERLLRRIAAQPIQSVAVLPLENLSGDPQQEYFADGMTEELTTELGKISGLRVISRTSARHYKGTHKTLPEIARELNVDAVVEGAVLRSGDRLRITAQLIQAATDRHLWSETYERDLRDVLVLQDEVARAIAKAVKIKLSPQEQTRLASARPVNPEAYEAYLKGLYESKEWTEEGTKKGIVYFEQAIHKDPTYAEAWAGLAWAYARSGNFNWSPRQMAYLKAKQAALRALQLDETLTQAHTSLAFLDAREWAWAAAMKEIQRAIALDPNDAEAHQRYGYHLIYMGRVDESIPEMKRALELDPLAGNKHNSLGAALFLAGRYDEALEQFRQTPDPDANSDVRHRRMAAIYERRGMEKEALAELLTALRLGGKKELAGLVEQKYLASGYAEAKKTYLRGDIRELHRNVKYGHLPAFFIACDYALLGEKDKAFGWLEKAFRERDPTLTHLKTEHSLESVRSDSRFQDLLRRMGLPPYQQATNY